MQVEPDSEELRGTVVKSPWKAAKETKMIDRPTVRPAVRPARPADRLEERFVRDSQDKDKEPVVREERMTRSNSWAEEVEEVIGDNWLQDRTSNEDKNQWLETKRQPSSWAAGLNAQVEEQAGKLGARTNRRQKPLNPASDRMEDEHHCKVQKTIHHWFGESSSEQISDSSEEDGRDWNTVDREGRNKIRRKRTKERKERKTVEVAGKARRMVGLGPISDKDIEKQMKCTKDNNQAKCWAVKEHLATNYDYNQAELDELKILETKRTNRDEIIYIAVGTEREIKDIYQRKAECMNDKTIVKNYIPPHFFERFSALNRICTLRRSEDSNLKTQIRFGYKDLMVLTKEKGSTDAFKEVDLLDFTGHKRLPNFDMTVRWKVQEDRPPRRRITSNRPSDQQETTTSPTKESQPTRTPALQNQPTRQLSTDSQDENTRKKQRKTSQDREQYEKPTSRQQKDDSMDLDPMKGTSVSSTLSFCKPDTTMLIKTVKSLNSCLKIQPVGSVACVFSKKSSIGKKMKENTKKNKKTKKKTKKIKKLKKYKKNYKMCRKILKKRKNIAKKMTKKDTKSTKNVQKKTKTQHKKTRKRIKHKKNIKIKNEKTKKQIKHKNHKIKCLNLWKSAWFSMGILILLSQYTSNINKGQIEEIRVFENTLTMSNTWSLNSHRQLDMNISTRSTTYPLDGNFETRITSTGGYNNWISNKMRNKVIKTINGNRGGGGQTDLEISTLE